MTPLAASISDATIWTVTFNDTRSVDYDRNSFIIQATGWPFTKHLTNNRGFASRVTRLGEILSIGYFLLGYFSFLSLNKQFQNTVYCTYFNIQKQLNVTIFDFLFELL